MKIAVVGAGSAQFVAELADLCALDGTGRYEVALVDTDPGRLAVVEQFGRLVAAEMDVPVIVDAYSERGAALDGVDLGVESVEFGDGVVTGVEVEQDPTL